MTAVDRCQGAARIAPRHGGPREGDVGRRKTAGTGRLRLRRRDLITLIGASLASAAVWAQPAKTYRLGVLENTRNTFTDEFLKALRDRGYVEGQNLILEWRFSKGVGERWPELARELVALKVDAILVETTPAALAAKQATSTIPIIIPTAIDPVGAGLAESLAAGRQRDRAVDTVDRDERQRPVAAQGSRSGPEPGGGFVERGQPGIHAGLARIGRGRPLAGGGAVVAVGARTAGFAPAFAAIPNQRPD